MMKRLLTLLAVGLLAAPAAAQTTWYARGEFNGWDTSTPMTGTPGGEYTANVTGLFDNQNFQFKVATSDWTTNMPGGNSIVTSNAAGNITINMWDQTTWTDGWLPNNQRRVGYVDPQEYGWDVQGSFDGWTTGFPLTSMGNGLYSAQMAFPAGSYDFKFRKAGDWAVNYGKDFSNNSPNNNNFVVQSNGDVWQFDLDLPNGRLRAFSTSQHGDFNLDGNTDAADYVYWRKNMPGNSAKYTEWRSNYGKVATWNAHGSFGPDVTMTDQGGGIYSTTLTGLTPGTNYDVQALRSDGLVSAPDTAAKVEADASGNINLHFYKNSTWSDGWNPSNTSRLGYDDSHQFGWEVIGSFNGWPGADDPNYNLTDQGNGLYTGSFAMPVAGNIAFKFRKQGDWSISVGNTFSNSATDNPLVIANAGDIWNFQLDLPNGRWRAFPAASGLATGAVPEPASLALAMFGLAFLGLARRR